MFDLLAGGTFAGLSSEEGFPSAGRHLSRARTGAGAAFSVATVLASPSPTPAAWNPPQGQRQGRRVVGMPGGGFPSECTH